MLAHLVLLGNFVWQAGKPEIWVDGDLFGMREKAGETLPTVGRWPTGDGRRGGNLHMWFWLTPPEHVTMTIDPVKANVTARGHQDFNSSVTGTENRAVKFDPIDPGAGSIQPAQGQDAVWTYTAPQPVLVRRTVSITAESVADPNQRQTALVTRLPGFINPLSIEPDKAELAAGGRRDFTVRAEGADDGTVDVALDPPPGLGTLTLVNKNEGRWSYKAPSKVERPVTESIIVRRPKTPTDLVKAVVSLRPAPAGPPSRSPGSATKKSVSRKKAPGRRKA